ncbi:MAG: hypothetical protein Q6373_017445 [Candidatus Sigynarchaeota archaeon]
MALEIDPMRVIFGSLSAALQLAGFVFIFRNFMKKRYRSSKYIAIAWFCFMLEAAFYSAKYFFEKTSDIHSFFNLLENLSLIPGFLAMLALIDSVSRDTIDPRKFSIAMLVLGADATLFVITFNSPELVVVPILIVVSFGLLVGVAWFYFCIKIYRNVPRSLKRPALINIIGAFLVSIMYILTNKYIGGFSKVIPSIDRIFQAVGALMHAVVLMKHDQLCFTLPFKTQRLVVINTRTGMSLFTYTWHELDRPIDEDLFSSMLHGISLLVNESVDKGDIQEIKMEKGVLLISRDYKYPVASVLVASKSSSVLREGLAAFNRQFINEFGQYVDNYTDTELFNDAKKLVATCFGFVPVFD